MSDVYIHIRMCVHSAACHESFSLANANQAESINGSTLMRAETYMYMFVNVSPAFFLLSGQRRGPASSEMGHIGLEQMRPHMGRKGKYYSCYRDTS